ncbi:MAG TPA: hypothetical protein VN087_06935 [Verrucomicrobiae bacterium]|jgi:hypothetical protein|nr:hypothetical protein [Verrucomicrobiae bacterium]
MPFCRESAERSPDVLLQSSASFPKFFLASLRVTLVIVGFWYGHFMGEAHTHRGLVMASEPGAARTSISQRQCGFEQM